MKPVTQNDIAKALGISQTTVALVVGRNNNHKGRSKLSDETVLRIQTKARELGYRPNRFAQVMRKGQSTQIGIIFTSSNLQVSNERAFHMATAIKANGYEPVFYDENCHQKGLGDAFETMLDAKVAGIILASTVPKLEAAIRVNELPVPLIGISATDVGEHRLVRCDMRDGMLQVFRHLVGQGCRSIVLISPFRAPELYGTWCWQQQMQAWGVEEGTKECGGDFSVLPIGRYAQWRKAIGKQGGVVSAVALCTTHDIDRANSQWQPHFSGIAVAQRLLNSGGPLPDAIICPNDDWAFGLSCELIRSGIEIPRDIAVTGFNDSAVCDVFTVPFTSVRQPTEAICKLAVELLSQEIAGLPPKHEVYDIKGTLIARDSSRFRAHPGELRGPLNRPTSETSPCESTSGSKI